MDRLGTRMLSNDVNTVSPEWRTKRSAKMRRRWLRLSHMTFSGHRFDNGFVWIKLTTSFIPSAFSKLAYGVLRKSHAKSFTSNSDRVLHLARKNTRRSPWLRPPAAHVHQRGTRPSWRGCHVSRWRRQRRPWCQRFGTSLKHLCPRASPWLLWQWLWTRWDEKSLQ